MTGKINLLNRADSSGFIVADNGARLHFKSSELFAYDIGRLEVGQVVTFDFKEDRPSEAIHVYPQRSLAAQDAKGHLRRTDAPARYVGFDHQGSIRCYRFELNPPGQAVQTVVFQIHLKVMMQHHIAVQDGPNLCRHVLTARHITFSSPALRLREFTIGDADILAYKASLPSARAKPKYGARKPALAVGASGA